VNLKENGLTISTRIDFNSLLNGLGTPLNFLLPTFCVGIKEYNMRKEVDAKD